MRGSPAGRATIRRRRSPTRWSGRAWPSAKLHAQILSALPTGHLPRASTMRRCTASWRPTPGPDADRARKGGAQGRGMVVPHQAQVQ